MANATPAPATPSSALRIMDPSIPPTDGSCPFNALPNELRDIIFDYAYVKDANEPFRTFRKREWEASEATRRRREKRRFVVSLDLDFAQHTLTFNSLPLLVRSSLNNS